MGNRVGKEKLLQQWEPSPACFGYLSRGIEYHEIIHMHYGCRIRLHLCKRFNCAPSESCQQWGSNTKVCHWAAVVTVVIYTCWTFTYFSRTRKSAGLQKVHHPCSTHSSTLCLLCQWVLKTCHVEHTLCFGWERAALGLLLRRCCCVVFLAEKVKVLLLYFDWSVRSTSDPDAKSTARQCTSVWPWSSLHDKEKAHCLCSVLPCHNPPAAVSSRLKAELFSSGNQGFCPFLSCQSKTKAKVMMKTIRASLSHVYQGRNCAYRGAAAGLGAVLPRVASDMGTFMHGAHDVRGSWLTDGRLHGEGQAAHSRKQKLR